MAKPNRALKKTAIRWRLYHTIAELRNLGVSWAKCAKYIKRTEKIKISDEYLRLEFTRLHNLFQQQEQEENNAEKS